MTDLESFLASVPIFSKLNPEQIQEVASLMHEAHYAAGERIVRQGKYSPAAFFLRTGSLVVRVQRGARRETVASLAPGAVFGELSVLTNRPCSADVEVIVDADVVYLTRDDIAKLPKQREEILRGLMMLLAERLHDTVTQGARATERPVVLLIHHEHWQAPSCFAVELGHSLARMGDGDTLVVNIGGQRTQGEIRFLGGGAYCLDMGVESVTTNIRTAIADKLTDLKVRFRNIVLNPTGSGAGGICEAVEAFADHKGHLLGPGDSLDVELGPGEFVTQSSSDPTLPFLSGNQQLIQDVEKSETSYLSGQAATAEFLRTVNSLARFVADQQVGIALGGGAAWGWAHVGVLSALQRAGIPIDVVSGCSMGSVIGSLFCSGRSVEELRSIASYWRNRTRRFVEWQFWRMHLLNEKSIRKAFGIYFADMDLNRMATPIWVNAVDLQNGMEHTIRSGSVVEVLRASIALPGLLSPVAKKGSLLVDAGFIDPVPVKLIRKMGCRYAIAVNVMAPLEARPVNTRYPMNMFDVMSRCMRVMGHEIGQARSEADADVMLAPRVGDISMLQFDRFEEIIECGRVEAEEKMPAIVEGYARLKSSLSVQDPAECSL